MPVIDKPFSEKTVPLEHISPPEKNCSLRKKTIPLEQINPPGKIRPSEQIATTEKIVSVENNACDSSIPTIRWNNDFLPLTHRFRNLRIEYLVKQKQYPYPLGIWRKGIEIGDHPNVIEYISNLSKPNTR